jgi:hypothetical protein
MVTFNLFVLGFVNILFSLLVKSIFNPSEAG